MKNITNWQLQSSEIIFVIKNKMKCNLKRLDGSVIYHYFCCGECMSLVRIIIGLFEILMSKYRFVMAGRRQSQLCTTPFFQRWTTNLTESRQFYAKLALGTQNVCNNYIFSEYKKHFYRERTMLLHYNFHVCVTLCGLNVIIVDIRFLVNSTITACRMSHKKRFTNFHYLSLKMKMERRMHLER